jgi:hypothetical protein
MTTYVLGAGASCHAGYPLANSMGSQLFLWMKNQGALQGYASRYPAAAQYLEEVLGPPNNVEEMLSNAQKMIDDYENGTVEQRGIRAVLAGELGVLANAVRGWFAEIRLQERASAYRRFARDIVFPGDRIITFNYDVSLDRELGLAGRFAVGDGYGFPIESLPENSHVKILKLHGSTNWLALIFGGLTSGFAQFELGNTLGSRPVIARDELAFLGCAHADDPAFQNGGGALPVMIMPTRSKEFFFAANTGIEYVKFWDNLWRQAAAALQAADRVLICGYGMPPADQRARDLLLRSVNRNAEVVVGCGGDTSRIVLEYHAGGYTRARAADEVMFEKWVDSCASGAGA